ncbi:hypothetical protein TWF481_010333 [Arthrobotrys musiformis]|uniref:chitinase n=1 Tax=Arthrobotrys musiformis TaxID=47236 RepID=A0AAV9W0J0_9PEZI
MVTPSWLAAAAGAFILAPGAVAFIPPVGTVLRPVDFCPERCAISGPSPGNWSVYPNFRLIERCQQTMFYSFNIYDPVDDPDTNHRIQACSSYGVDFSSIPPQPVDPKLVESAKSVDVDFELGWWSEGFDLAKPAIQSLVRQIRDYIDNGHGALGEPFIFFGQSGQATIGVYIGEGLLRQSLSTSALQGFENILDTFNVSTPSLAMQLCGHGYDSTHIFGIAVASDATFTPIQDAIKSWHNATCLSFVGTKNVPGKATFTTPLLNVAIPINSTVLDIDTKPLQARANCRTIQVESGDGCAQLAAKCRISGADFTKYNPGICAKLKPKQHVCCSSGTLPDLRPKPNKDGSCFAYKIEKGESCDSLAAQYGLTVDQIKGFNKKTWGWVGCNPLFAGARICLSTGSPPFPAPIPNAVCGPQKPGSTPPPAGSNIADLNPCPLNACCNIWGQCGLTKDFCVDTNTGAPGTAKPGTYGCISNCGLDVIPGNGNGAMRIAYFQGYGMSRKCLYQDALQIDASKYTHIHFGFGTLTPSYEVEVGDKLSSYQFTEFKRITGAKRILSFGGWEFSTAPRTYKIFREGVKDQNRLKMATKIADFIKKHDLDGVDIDWEYPGAPDLPDFDPGKAEDGPNYLRFLAVLKSLLPGKTVAIAAPASYWYLKQFPIKGISMIVDYIVYMTYDLHGQWDAQNQWAQEGCSTGNCLRSQVNLTETMQSLAMITKAGVPGNKIVVGVTSYGRSFGMEKPGCWGPNCKFTGTRLQSHATPGRCTGTGGYIADAEINEIIRGTGPNGKSRVVTQFLDPGSNTDILVYDNNQWVGYMSAATKQTRTAIYKRLGMAGTTDWAVDLQEFHTPPRPVKDWPAFIALAASGANPKQDTTTIGKWRSFQCTHPAIVKPSEWTPSERWKVLDADSAWKEVVTKWFNTDRHNRRTFIQSAAETLRMGGDYACDTFEEGEDKCHSASECEKGLDGPESGPAASLIWASLTKIHRMHHAYYKRMSAITGIYGLSVDDMEKTFAPVPEPKTNQWLNIFIDLITIGTLTTAAPFFNMVLKQMPAFAKTSTYDNAKDTALTLIGQSTTLAKDALSSPPSSPWTPHEQDKFSNYMGQVILGWMKDTERTVKRTFNGSEETVKALGAAIADGKLIDGKWDGDAQPPASETPETDLRSNILKSFYVFSIPILWRRSKTFAFIMDSGANCDGRPLEKYLEDSTADKTGVCYEGRRYYLVHPQGEAQICKCQRLTDIGPCQPACRDQKFSAPPGIDDLARFNGITKEDLVIGSVRTWLHRGKTNEAGRIDFNDNSVRRQLAEADLTTPGIIQLPVCGPDRAFQSWKTSSQGSSANYPCDVPPGIDKCRDSSFEDRTSGASPLVSDCLQIIRNIEGNAQTEWTHSITGHRTILQYGSCKFGIERTGGTGGAVQFQVGGQDVIDVINDSVRRYGGNGKVGAEGVMSCVGTTAGTRVDVKWGLF